MEIYVYRCHNIVGQYIVTSGSKEEARTKGGNAMVGTGGFVFGGDVDSGLGGGVDRGGGGDGQDRDCDGQLVKLGG